MPVGEIGTELVLVVVVAATGIGLEVVADIELGEVEGLEIAVGLVLVVEAVVVVVAVEGPAAVAVDIEVGDIGLEVVDIGAGTGAEIETSLGDASSVHNFIEANILFNLLVVN